MNDILTQVLGTLEHLSRIRGVGQGAIFTNTFVKPHVNHRNMTDQEFEKLVDDKVKI